MMVSIYDRACRQRVTDVEAWIVVVANLCLNASISEVVPADFRVALSDFCASTAVASARASTPAGSGRKSASHHSQNGMLTYGELDKLFTQARSFCVALPREIELIRQVSFLLKPSAAFYLKQFIFFLIQLPVSACTHFRLYAPNYQRIIQLN